MSKKKQTYFSDSWLSDLRFCLWLEKPNDSSKAMCKLCKKSFNLSNMGIKALQSHAQGEGHKKRVKEKEEIQNFFKKSSIAKEQQPASSQNVQQKIIINENSSPTTIEIPAKTASSSTSSFVQQTLNHSILESQSLTAEIIWSLKCVVNGYSNNSNIDMNDTFKAMFPDSIIAKNYRMSASKLQYFVNFGLAPYFKGELIQGVNKSNFVSVGFDESLNSITQSCQMDLTVRYWDVNKVQVRYYDSSFLGHTTANDLLSNPK